MNLAHVHLLLNHVPILGSLFAVILLSWGFSRRDGSATRIGLLTLVVTALFAVPAYFTGSAAEAIVEHAPGASEHAIHPHEEAAELASYVSWVVGLIAVTMLWRARRSAAAHRRTTAIALALALLTWGLMAWTSLLGGLIRHSEIRGDALDRAITANAADSSMAATATNGERTR